MSRTSRIPHPAGSRFVSLHAWAVRRFGVGGAAVLGLLDFYDRAQEMPNQPLVSRERLVADLQGIVGKGLVDQALRNLVDAGAICRHEFTRMGERNWITRAEYGLDVAGLARLLATPETGSSGDSQFRESPKVPKPGPESGVTNKSLEEEVEAAAHEHARGLADAAATFVEQKRKHPRRTDSGIECWYPSEDEPANKIEASYFPDQIAAAVAVIKARPNGKGKSTSPVPALVDAELERARQAAEIAARQASVAEKAMRDAEAHPVLSTAIQRQRIAALASAWPALNRNNRSSTS